MIKTRRRACKMAVKSLETKPSLELVTLMVVFNIVIGGFSGENLK